VTLRFDPLTGWTFDTPAGPRALRDLDGLPSGRQLRLLAARGLLELRDVPGVPLRKVDCALAIERAGYTRRTDADLAADMLEVVGLHPGLTWAETRALVRGADARLAWIRDELTKDGLLVIRREGMRMRLYVPQATTELGA
jgi:hypothetical protein